MLEKDLLNYARKVFALNHCKVIHLPNCITRVINGKFMNIVVDAGNKGFPDLLILGPNSKWIMIELKSEKGKLRPEQEEFRVWCNENNYPWSLCRTFEEIDMEVRNICL